MMYTPTRIVSWSKNAISIFAALVVTMFMASAALADDWIAERLRGKVVAFNGTDWIEVQRGDIISDDRTIRTLSGARVTLVRDAESIELASNTQVRIIDFAGPKYTTVHQDFGSVTVEAEVRNVQHFSVQTPYLAAVVKGTMFTVDASDDGGTVKVERGRVNVKDTVHGLNTDITPGQRANVSRNTGIDISGPGQHNPIFDDDGNAFTEDQAQDLVSNNGNGNGNGGGNGNGLGLGLGGGNSGGNGNGLGLGLGGGNSGGNGNGLGLGLGNGNSGGNGNGGGINIGVGGGGNGNGGGINIGVGGGSNGNGGGINIGVGGGGNGGGGGINIGLGGGNGNGNNGGGNGNGNNGNGNGNSDD